MARTSSAWAKVRTIVSRPTGIIIAPPIPCNTRQPRSPRLLARPHSTEPTVKSPIAAAKTRRVPNRSAIQPLTGMNTARLSV